MKKSRKAMALLLCMVMALSLAACSDDNDRVKYEPSTKETTTANKTASDDETTEKNTTKEDMTEKDTEEETTVKEERKIKVWRQFGSMGNLYATTYYDVNGNIESIDDRYGEEKYFYDENNNLIKIVEYVDGSIYHTYEYYYDRNQNLIKEVETHSDGSQGIIKYSYNDLNQLITKRDDGIIDEKYTYTYDEDGNVKQMNEYWNNELKWYTQYVYDIRGNCIEHFTFKSGNSDYIEHYKMEYDEDNNLTKITEYVPETGEIWEYEEYEYDDNGNVTKETIWCSYSKEQLSICEYNNEYEYYDEEGMDTNKEEEIQREQEDLKNIKSVYNAMLNAYSEETCRIDAYEISELFDAITLEDLFAVENNKFVESIKSDVGKESFEISSVAAKDKDAMYYVGIKNDNVRVWIGGRNSINKTEQSEENQYFKMGYVSESDLYLEGDTRTVELTLWLPEAFYGNYQNRECEWIEKVCDDFESDYPEWNIIWNYENVGFFTSVEYAIDRPENAADIFLFTSDSLDNLVEADVLLPLGTGNTEYLKEQVSSECIESVTHNGKIYGIPYSTNNWFMYYDKSVFKDVDITTLDEMLKVGKVAFPIENPWYIQAFFLANGCTFSREKFDFGGEKAEEALKYLKDKYESGKLIKSEGVELLQEGKVDAAMGGIWNSQDVKKYLGSNYGVAAIPKINVSYGDGQLRTMANTYVIGINKNTKYSEIALEFVKFMTNKRTQDKAYKELNIVPNNKLLLATDEYKNDELVQAVNKSFDNASILQPDYLTSENWWSPATELGKAITSGTITDIKNEITKFNEKLNSNLP